MKRPAVIAGAATLAALLGAAVPFTGRVLGAVGTVATAAFNGASAPSAPTAPTAKAAATATTPPAPTPAALPSMPHVNGATNSELVNCAQAQCTTVPGAGPNGGTCGQVVDNEQYCVWGPAASAAAPAAASWSCTVMSGGGTLEIRASLWSGYAASVAVNFSDGTADRFPPVTYPVNETAPYTLWEPVPPGDIGASAEPTTCTAS